MSTQCKLYTDTHQLIPPDTWTTVRFDVVLRNDHSMYQGNETVDDPGSALIQPDRSGDFLFFRFVKWAPIAIPDGDNLLRDFHERFVRDPYTNPDGTGETDGPDTTGQDLRVSGWPFRGRAGQPVAVQVRHGHHEPVEIIHAQFAALTWDY